MSVVPVVFMALFLTLIAAGVVLSIRYRKQEINNFTHIAQARGWAYPVSDIEVTTKFPFLSHVRVQHLHDVIKGEHKGIPFYAFNYEVKRKTKANGSREDRYYTCHAVLIETPTRLPQIRFEGDQYAGLYIPRSMAQPDVLIGYLPFDNKWQIITQDPNFAKSLLQQPLTEHMAHNDGPAWQVIEGYVLARFPRSQTSESVVGDVEGVVRLLELIDERVWAYYDPQSQMPTALHKKQ